MKTRKIVISFVNSIGHPYLFIYLFHSFQCSRDDFGVSWKTQNDNSASCGAIRVPIVVKSNEMFYSKRGTDFMTVFKTELEESSQKVLDSLFTLFYNFCHSH